MAKKLPKRIYMRWNLDHDEPFLEAQIDPKDLREGETTVLIGEYRLVAVKKLINETRIE